QRDPAGCYRVYQGALIVLEADLGHHPKLQEEIRKGPADAEKMGFVAERAFALNKLLFKVRDHLNPSPQKEEKKTLWDRLGGESNVAKVIDDVTESAAKDPKVNLFRQGIMKLDEVDADKLKKQLLDFVSQYTGGPYKYKGRSMKEVHKGMKITDAEFD